MSVKYLILLSVLFGLASCSPKMDVVRRPASRAANCFKAMNRLLTHSARPKHIKNIKIEKLVQKLKKIWDYRDAEHLIIRYVDLEKVDAAAEAIFYSPFFKYMKLADSEKREFIELLNEMATEDVKARRRTMLREHMMGLLDSRFQALKDNWIFGFRDKARWKANMKMILGKEKTFLGKAIGFASEKGKFLGKAYFFPIVFQVKLPLAIMDGFRHYGVKGIYKIPVQVMSREKKTGMMWLTLLTTQAGIVYYFDFMTDFDDYITEVEEEVEVPNDALVVYISGASGDDPWLQVDKFDFENRLLRHENKVFLQVQSKADLKDALERIAAERGPINHVILSGHGIPGKIQVGRDFLDKEGLADVAVRPGTFAKGASGILSSCLTANNNVFVKGEDFLDELGQTWFKGGGTLYGSNKVLFMGDLMNHIEWEKVKEDKSVVEEIGSTLVDVNLASAMMSAIIAERLLSEDDANVRKVTIPSSDK